MDIGTEGGTLMGVPRVKLLLLLSLNMNLALQSFILAALTPFVEKYYRPSPVKNKIHGYVPSNCELHASDKKGYQPCVTPSF